MNIEDVVQLLNNRLREFQLSRDYAKMSGDLERMNAADKEVLSLEDTLYKLNLLIDVSKSDTVKEATLSEIITDGSVAVLGEYDITPYATDPLHEQKIMTILSKMEVMDTAEKIDEYIKGKYPSSPVDGEMILSAAVAYDVDARLMMAIMEQDSSFGTAGKAVRTLNPGNVGNDDSGNIRTYESWQKGVTAVAEWLSRHRGSTESVASVEELFPVTTPPTASATSTGELFPVTTSSTTTTTTATSTPVTTSPTASATSTGELFPVTTSSTTTTTTSATSTPTSATTGSATSTEELLPVTTPTSITTTSVTTTPVTTPTEEPVPATATATTSATNAN